MRVLLTSASMQAGGAERVVVTLATELAKRGHEVALSAPLGVRDEDLRGTSHARYPLTDYDRTASGILRTGWQLADAIRDFQPDVVHAQNIKASVIARVGVTFGQHPLRGSPVLASFQGVLPGEYRRSAWLLRTASHVACVSSDLVDNIVAAGLPIKRTSLVRNAVTPAAPLDPESRAVLDDELEISGAPVISIIGRLVPQKAHDRFITAMRHVATARPEVRALIVGEGPRRGELERQIEAEGLKKHILMTGLRSDPRRIMARSELVVFSSDWEGLSLVALEALSAGTPVVSTDIQGMRELFDNGCGAVVPLDDGTALGKRIVDLLQEDAVRQAMGKAGKELITRDYSASGMVDAYEQLYGQLIDRR